GHQACRPYKVKKNQEVDCGLPRYLAAMYLDWRGEWQLRPLNGIASAPMLREDGTIFCAEGYDPESCMFLEKGTDVASPVPENPTLGDALSALRYIRDTFKSFPFADAEMIPDWNSAVLMVDISKPPGVDESGFLTAFLTAVCRPSLPLAPGLLLRAAP